MSHADGALQLMDSRILYCEYNGTVDVMRSPIYNTYEEMKANWRSDKWIICTNLNHKHVFARIATSYGRGYSWDGIVCLECMCIVEGHECNYPTRQKDLPEWFPNREAYRL